jgi:hypothetical protein
MVKISGQPFIVVACEEESNVIGRSSLKLRT